MTSTSDNRTGRTFMSSSGVFGVLEGMNVNCTDSRSLCESDDWLLDGVAGTCEPSSGICICPKGYTGRDEWTEWNTCHISETSTERLHIVLLILAVMFFIVSTLGLVILLRKWGLHTLCPSLLDPAQGLAEQGEGEGVGGEVSAFQSGKRRPSGGTGAGAASGHGDNGDNPQGIKRRKSLAAFVKEVPKRLSKKYSSNSNLAATARTPAQNAMVKERRRKWLTLVIILLVIIFTFFGALYEAGFLMDPPRTRRENDPYGNVSFCFAVISILSGLWLFTYLWFGSLPSVRLYGKLFGLSTFLVKFPELVKLSTIIHITGNIIFMVLLLVIVPAAMPEKRADLNTFVLLFIGLYVADFTVSLLYVCHQLNICFQSFNDQLLKVEQKLVEETPEGGKPKTNIKVSKAENKSFQKAKQTVRLVRILLMIFGPVAVVLMFSSVFWRFARRNLFITIGLIAMIAFVASAVFLWVMIFRTSGPNLRPSRRKRRNLHHVQVQQGTGGQSTPIVAADGTGDPKDDQGEGIGLRR